MFREFVAEELVKVAKDLLISKYVDIFDNLRTGQRILIAFHNNEFKEFIVGRKSHSKKYNVTSIIVIPEDQQDRKWQKNNAFRLVKNVDQEGNIHIGGARGNMGIPLKGIKKASVMAASKWHRTKQGWKTEGQAETAAKALRKIGYKTKVVDDGNWYRIDWSE
jgi:hypothetical protein